MNSLEPVFGNMAVQHGRLCGRGIAPSVDIKVWLWGHKKPQWCAVSGDYMTMKSHKDLPKFYPMDLKLLTLQMCMLPQSCLLCCGPLLWSSPCWCPWPGAASRSSPGWSGCSRSACRSGPCRSPSRPARGWESRRDKEAGWTGWSSVPGGWCKPATQGGPGLTKIPSDWAKEEREEELWVICGGF